MKRSDIFIPNNVIFEDCKYILSYLNTKKLKDSKILILGGNSFIATYLQAVLVILKCRITSVSLNKPRGLFKSIHKVSKIKFVKMDLTNEKKVNVFKLLISKFEKK